MVQRDGEHLHQVIRFFIDKINDTVDNNESINNVKNHCSDNNISAHQVEYWSKDYY